MSSPADNIPPRPSLRLFAILALAMVFFSYLFTVLLAAACVYLPWLAIVNAPSFQTVALFAGGVVIAGIMVWSLIPRRDKFEAPGLLLESASHPALFAEIEKIAQSLREPVPDEVYLIGDPNAWVADRDGLIGFGARRVMGVGLPLLSALTVSQFRAVLAHEFAHYYGGDTRLGPWLHRTQIAMIRTFRGIGSVGEHELPVIIVILYVIVFGILKWYWLMFLRAINFVSRRQEYRADELACILTGPECLTGGLRMIHAASLAWPTYWETEVAPMLNLGCLPSIALGFSEFLTVPPIAKGLQSAIESEIREGKIDAYDSHPPLRDRLTAIEALAIQSQSGDLKPALELLNDADAEELRFLEATNPNLSNNALKRASWEEAGSKVLIPSWADFVTQYSSLLAGITPETLYEALGRLPQIASKIRDPKGMLLTREQRVERARSLLATAFALSLVNNGWRLHSRPGEFYLSRGDEQLNPYNLIQRLSDGGLSRESWVARCRELGIGSISLEIAAKNEVVSPNIARSGV